MKVLLAVGFSLLCFSLPSVAEISERTVLPLTLTDNGFLPAELTAFAGNKLIIRMTNKSSRVAELESYDMKFEKIAPQGKTVSVFAGPLRPGKYRFFDDYSLSGYSGWLTIREE
ncbi:cupredoxin domain-containing protein [Erwinia typographi]|uniref:cupredoxin domain-containing protein n=1 Tax=Erwinia typographi TaxID=371042 RepID=UPI00068C6ADE|nr:cupredoxin domain-containing protein [Erwinia typographi]